MDTLRLANRLTAEGRMDEGAAKAVASAIGDELDRSLVTKDQLELALSQQTNRLIIAMIAVAGISLTVAKLIG